MVVELEGISPPTCLPCWDSSHTNICLLGQNKHILFLVRSWAMEKVCVQSIIPSFITTYVHISAQPHCLISVIVSKSIGGFEDDGWVCGELALSTAYIAPSGAWRQKLSVFKLSILPESKHKCLMTQGRQGFIRFQCFIRSWFYVLFVSNQNRRVQQK